MTNETTEECPVCKDEPEPGYIETPNNGPIIPCYFCNRQAWIKSLRDGHPLKEGAV